MDSVYFALPLTMGMISFSLSHILTEQTLYMHNRDFNESCWITAKMDHAISLDSPFSIEKISSLSENKVTKLKVHSGGFSLREKKSSFFLNSKA